MEITRIEVAIGRGNFFNDGMPIVPGADEALTLMAYAKEMEAEIAKALPDAQVYVFDVSDALLGPQVRVTPRTEREDAEGIVAEARATVLARGTFWRDANGAPIGLQERRAVSYTWADISPNTTPAEALLSAITQNMTIAAWAGDCIDNMRYHSETTRDLIDSAEVYDATQAMLVDTIAESLTRSEAYVRYVPLGDFERKLMLSFVESEVASWPGPYIGSVGSEVLPGLWALNVAERSDKLTAHWASMLSVERPHAAGYLYFPSEQESREPVAEYELPAQAYVLYGYSNQARYAPVLRK